MFITILDRYTKPSSKAKSQVFLTWDDWNDYNFYTLFSIHYVDENSIKHDLDIIKIGFYNQKEHERKLSVGNLFEQLPNEFFSLGSYKYYEELNKLGSKVREKILFALRDIAWDSEIYKKSINEKVTLKSLLRGKTRTEVTGQIRRMAGGGSRLTAYNFSFESNLGTDIEPNISLFFDVEPESNPPTNINVLIGRNGSGKTTIINNMIKSLLYLDSQYKYGKFKTHGTLVGNFDFANLISISFSAFDESGVEDTFGENYTGLQFSYIGIKKYREDKTGDIFLKTPSDLKDEFIGSLKKCKDDLKTDRWKSAISILESDPNFKDADILSLIQKNNEIQDQQEMDNQFIYKASSIFSNLSSGHKIVLLTITRLVETLEEKSLVLIDEPETHLHPPLLSAFIRSLSELLISRNGVAIIATHSPVILQEVPKSCAWKLRRNGTITVAERLEIESFGENVGILTQEVFNLEVTESGFHKFLKNAVAGSANYEDAITMFNNRLGLEAKAILRSLFFQKENESNT